jgi:hypothetical protein
VVFSSFFFCDAGYVTGRNQSGRGGAATPLSFLEIEGSTILAGAAGREIEGVGTSGTVAFFFFFFLETLGGGSSTSLAGARAIAAFFFFFLETEGGKSAGAVFKLALGSNW